MFNPIQAEQQQQQQHKSGVQAFAAVESLHYLFNQPGQYGGRGEHRSRL